MIGKLRSLAATMTAFHLANVVPDDVLARQSVRGKGDADDFSTETPINQIIAVFQENAPFDHYFGADSPRRNPRGRNPVSSKGRHGRPVPVVSHPT